MPSLKWIRAEGRPKVFSIVKTVTSIGKAGGNDVCLEDRTLTNRAAAFHAQITFDGKDFQLGEIDTEAEILVNGKKKRRIKLQHGDRVRLEDVELEFSCFDEGHGAQAQSGAAQTLVAEIGGLRKLHDFSQALMRVDARGKANDDLLATLLDAVIEATSASKGFVILTEGTDEIRTKICVARNMAGRDLPPAIEQLSDSILSQVIQSRQALIVSDAQAHTLFGKSESVMNLQLSSVMCAPLLSRGELLGLIYIGNESVRGLFDEGHLDVLTVFASQASLLLENARLLEQLISDADDVRGQLREKQFGNIIGNNPSLMEVFRKCEKVSATDVSVLISGETGTGKELIAQEIHRRSPRAKGPFIVVNCGAIPENLMESELFGHVRGAFTGAIATKAGKFQAANGGTLFLDEIGELPLNLQVKLLRVLQERMVTKVGETKPERIDIRVISATNRNLEEEAKKGTFREDLYYRLNVVNLHLPPLRERGDDVIVLAKFMLQKYAVEFSSSVKGFTPSAIAAIRKYEWPGNVRQLENRVKKALVLCDRSLVGPEDLDLFPEALASVMTLAQAREDFQRRYILEVLERNSGNRTKTARDLGVDPRTIFRYLEREPDATPPGGADEG